MADTVGGAEGDRTPDLRIANATLSQLSYGPNPPTNGAIIAAAAARWRAWRTMRSALSAVKRGPDRRAQSVQRSPQALAGGSTPGYGRRLFFVSGVCLMRALLWLIDTLIDIYIWLLIAQAVLSWLLAFGVVNRHNRAVAVIGDFLYRVTEPALRPIRAFLPSFGGIDISPIIVILILMFLRRLILYDIAPGLF